jgi:hypothetical protein
LHEVAPSGILAAMGFGVRVLFTPLLDIGQSGRGWMLAALRWRTSGLQDRR